ncbi:DUF4167 domain-containing protein [Sneathiella sp. HT1-7]|uniref:DUF4167 domain-containing protein n=1 Tax=Sneathiella sp. HT1-7 TaxID=2887192 RepID=UPI001D156F8B|nr:DUF4167 domain-containing protein [Sneathiella sp. HT1-7]MCC3303184.1 DUF4167 domain-containing protein [Sneathiella sp. HT1-7]
MRVSSNRRPRGGRTNSGGNRPGSGNNRRQNGGNRNYDSNGPDGKIRGTANQVYDKYTALGTDAQTSGDRVAAENYFQHAEHYFRIIAANTIPPKEKQPVESSENTPVAPENENATPAPRKARNRNNEEQASGSNEQDEAQSNPVVDLGTTEQPVIELASENDAPKSSEASDGEEDGEVKPKRKVSRTRTLRRRTSSRNVGEEDPKEANTTD